MATTHSKCATDEWMRAVAAVGALQVDAGPLLFGSSFCIDSERRILVMAAHVWRDIQGRRRALDPFKHGVAIGFKPLEPGRAEHGEIDWVGRAFLCKSPGVLDPPSAAAPKGLDLVVLRLTQGIDGSLLAPGREMPAALGASDNAQRHTLAALPLGDASTLAPGEQLVVLGLGRPNAESGSIVRPVFPTFTAPKDLDSGRWIETPAAVHGGHSGGPVLTARGEIVGWVSRSQPEGHVYVIDEHRPVDPPSKYTEPMQCIWGAVAAALGVPDQWQQPDVLQKKLNSAGTIAARTYVYDPSGRRALNRKVQSLQRTVERSNNRERMEHARGQSESRRTLFPLAEGEARGRPPSETTSNASLEPAFNGAASTSDESLRLAQAEAEAAAAHKHWFDHLSPEQQEGIRVGKIPVIVVIGETGAGKSTAINRMAAPVSEKRAEVMKESDTAAAGTAKTDAQLLFWLGEKERPTVFIDMPGLNDPEGKDTTIIRDACDFLMSAPFPGVHQVVLVINGQSTRLSKPLKEVICVLRDVFDADGKQGFVNYLSVMFTKMPFESWALKSKEEFKANVDAREAKLGDSWASPTEGLGQEDVLNLTQTEANALKKRFLFVNNGLEPEMIAHLQKKFDLRPELGIGDVYLSASRHLKKPFSLSAMNSKAMTTEQQILATTRQVQEQILATTRQVQTQKAQLERQAIQLEVKDALDGLPNTGRPARAATTVQKAYRMQAAVRNLLNARRAAVCMQAAARRRPARLEKERRIVARAKRRAAAAVRVQAAARRRSARLEKQRRIVARVRIQADGRRALKRRHFVRLRAAAVRVQSRVRGWIQRARLRTKSAYVREILKLRRQVELTAQNGREMVAAAAASSQPALIWAVMEGGAPIVKLLLEEHGRHDSEEKTTALAVAVRIGDAAVVKLLLENGASPAVATLVSCGVGRERVEKRRLTALMQGVRLGHEAVVKLLLEYGACPMANDDTSNDDTFNWCSCSRHREWIKDQNTVRSHKHFYKRTALSYANDYTEKYGNDSMARLLLEHLLRSPETYISNIGRFQGVSLLNHLLRSEAAAQGHVAMVKLLLEYGAEVNDVDQFGWTALMHAVHKQGDDAVVKLLLENGAVVDIGPYQYRQITTRLNDVYYESVRITAHMISRMESGSYAPSRFPSLFESKAS